MARAGSSYPWVLVGLLWLACFFNYADRQAVSAVMPLIEQEFGLNKEQLGLIGSAFSIVYAVMAPFSGYLVDVVSRRWLILGGLGFWSVICSATALSRRFWQLLVFRAVEGLGESCYFPASMSILSDYHGRATRSRAMSLHQTGVYAGTVGGAALAGLLAEAYGWRSPFWILGLLGMAYAVLLIPFILEPPRGAADLKRKPSLEDFDLPPPTTAPSPRHNLRAILGTPSACVLLAVFAGANFVAAVMLTWLPEFVYTKFHLGVARSTFAATVLHLASLVGAVCGGLLADRASRVRGGRMVVQAAALIVGAPWVFLLGWTGRFPLFLLAMIGAGFCKGLYDANIFASVYDVVSPQVRGTAAGLLNTVGWAGGSIAPWAIGRMADRSSLSLAIASTSVVYLAAGMLAILAARLAPPPASVGAASDRN